MTGSQDDFSSRVTALDDEALLRIVDAPEDYTPAALAAARGEIERRGGIERVRVLREPASASLPALEGKPGLLTRTFSRRGRFTRREFATVAALGLGLNTFAGYGPRFLIQTYGTEDIVALVTAVVLTLLCILGSFAILVGAAAQRLRDFHRSGWWALFALVPCLNLMLFVVLLIPPSAPSAPSDEDGAAVQH